jgi:hypothetical protein
MTSSDTRCVSDRWRRSGDARIDDLEMEVARLKKEVENLRKWSA